MIRNVSPVARLKSEIVFTNLVSICVRSLKGLGEFCGNLTATIYKLSVQVVFREIM